MDDCKNNDLNHLINYENEWLQLISTPRPSAYIANIAATNMLNQTERMFMGRRCFSDYFPVLVEEKLNTSNNDVGQRLVGGSLLSTPLEEWTGADRL